MYKIVKCPSCRNYFVIEATKTFFCRSCNYKINLTKLNIYYQSENFELIHNKIKELKKEEYEKRRSYDNI